MVCLTSVVYSLCSGENVKPAAVNLALVYLYIMSCFYITLMDVQICFPKAMWLTYKKELKLFATSVSYSLISEAPAYTVCAMRAHIVVLFRCIWCVYNRNKSEVKTWSACCPTSVFLMLCLLNYFIFINQFCC